MTFTDDQAGRLTQALQKADLDTLLPLVRAGLLDPARPIVADEKVGSSEGGDRASESTTKACSEASFPEARSARPAAWSSSETTLDLPMLTPRTVREGRRRARSSLAAAA